jgi:hypothetical protein
MTRDAPVTSLTDHDSVSLLVASHRSAEPGPVVALHTLKCGGWKQAGRLHSLDGVALSCIATASPQPPALAE